MSKIDKYEGMEYKKFAKIRHRKLILCVAEVHYE